MTNLKKKTIAAAISAAFAAAMAGATVANADDNPFAADIDGYDLLATSHEGAEEGEGDGEEGECGEGQCGEGDDKGDDEGDETSDEEA